MGINHGEKETPKKGSKKEKEELALKLKNLYKANKEDSKNSKPKKEEKERGEKKYVLKPKTPAVRTSLLPNPGYKQYIKEKEEAKNPKKVPKKVPAPKKPKK